ncbi:DUF2759 domain-containing protein [Aquisalibacillus elongatus]|uniref:Uncharacterized protein DUF2759 n=1 Tax=Aquisalibacillus elongatus TaxID=485577 RepID=A0A3N5C812_9BACI|nr:DUF2759 domain-containing protein [Aquisalibacillus elongatus]RPF55632.1 uncharacterized protein DUF2759 [Aquisalibacillus elongatus]
MVLGIILLFVAILSFIAVFREFKNRNVLALLFAGASALVFGWFSVMTIYSEILNLVTNNS